MHCQLRAIPSVSFLSFLFLRISRFVSGWQEVVNRRQRKNEKRAKGQQAMAGMCQPERQCGACLTHSFLNKHSSRRCGKAKDYATDMYINEWVRRAAPWPNGARANPPSPPPPSRSAHLQKEAQTVLAVARQKLQSAIAADLPESCITILKEQVRQDEKAMKKARPWDRKCFKRAVEAGGKALENVFFKKKTQKIFAEAHEEVLLAQTDLENLMKKSPMPVLAGSHLTPAFSKHWML